MRILILITSLAFSTAVISGCGTQQPRKYDAEHCQKLLAEADALKGKPLQRSAAMERYDKECTGY